MYKLYKICDVNSRMSDNRVISHDSVQDGLYNALICCCYVIITMSLRSQDNL